MGIDPFRLDGVGRFHPPSLKVPPMPPTPADSAASPSRGDVASTVLAVDLGGSALKASLFAVDGEALAAANVPLFFDEGDDGRSEQNPIVWWEALERATGEIARQDPLGLDRVAAVAICGFTRTQVFLDAAGEPVRPAIGFRDSRAQGEADAVLASASVAAHPEARHVNGFHPLARLLWLRKADASTWAATQTILEPKDYLNFRLTGRAVSDRISQFRLARALHGGEASLADITGIEKNVLPTLGDPADTVGEVRPGLPGALARIAGARVFCGSHDTWAAAAGLGALSPGRAYCISGSSEVFGLITNAEAEASGLITIRWGEDVWQVGGPGQNGANALAWIVDRLDPGDRPFARRLGDLLAQPASKAPLIFHPFLHGERVPYWDRDLRAAFLGLGSGHGPADMVRAVMEGVAFVNRIVLERAERAAGLKATEVRIAGGGGRNADWSRIRADVLDRPVLTSPVREMGLAGCLALARMGLGLDDGIARAAETVSPPLSRFQPDAARRQRYDALFSVFTETHDAVARASHLLARIGHGDAG